MSARHETTKASLCASPPCTPVKAQPSWHIWRQSKSRSCYGPRSQPISSQQCSHDNNNKQASIVFSSRGYNNWAITWAITPHPLPQKDQTLSGAEEREGCSYFKMNTSASAQPSLGFPVLSRKTVLFSHQCKCTHETKSKVRTLFFFFFLPPYHTTFPQGTCVQGTLPKMLRGKQTSSETGRHISTLPRFTRILTAFPQVRR